MHSAKQPLRSVQSTVNLLPSPRAPERASGEPAHSGLHTGAAPPFFIRSFLLSFSLRFIFSSNLSTVFASPPHWLSSCLECSLSQLFSLPLFVFALFFSILHHSMSSFYLFFPRIIFSRRGYSVLTPGLCNTKLHILCWALSSAWLSEPLVLLFNAI